MMVKIKKKRNFLIDFKVNKLKSLFDENMTKKIIKHFAESSPGRVNAIFEKIYNILYSPPPPRPQPRQQQKK